MESVCVCVCERVCVSVSAVVVMKVEEEGEQEERVAQVGPASKAFLFSLLQAEDNENRGGCGSSPGQAGTSMNLDEGWERQEREDTILELS